MQALVNRVEFRFEVMGLGLDSKWAWAYDGAY